ncbi:hypothetical protein B0H11DRAFT_2249988 [Mycena galericulata]|nr:hypothetical protein B0H11DRAFT_2264521 [Mycena galericulata]KAJ7444532.1 hypothetical protein B0H11DRAFT_2249988 [Mycena galericulata]
MSDPPDYENDDLADLIASLSDLDLASLQQSPPPMPPRTPPPRTPSPRQTTPVSNPLVYQYESPTKSGRTSDWSEAAHHTQGVAGATVHRMFKSRKAPRPKLKAYVVFYGRIPGTYAQWSGPDGAAVQVTGVSGSLYQGYQTPDEARSAFQYALTRGWTGQRPSPTGFVPTPIPSLPIPVSPPVSSQNPLHGQTDFTEHHRWHIVYAGITPGIYRSYLECALNTIRIPGALYDSAETRDEAERRWATAIAAGRVRFLTHPYSP